MHVESVLDTSNTWFAAVASPRVRVSYICFKKFDLDLVTWSSLQGTRELEASVPRRTSSCRNSRALPARD
jgi:hypothetical protein